MTFPHGWKTERYPVIMAGQAQAFQACLAVKNTRDLEKESLIIDWLTQIVAGGNEICTDMGLNWTYPQYAAILAMSKQNQNIWGQLSITVKQKIDLLARCLLIAIAAIAPDHNRAFYTGFRFKGNTCVEWSSNHMLSLVAPYLFLVQFFGSVAAAESIIMDFDYDTYLADIRSAGFTNIEAVWTSTAQKVDGEVITVKDLLNFNGKEENDYLRCKIIDPKTGLPINLGWFYCLKQPFSFRSQTACADILYELLQLTFLDLPITSTASPQGTNCYILDDTVSPQEGNRYILAELAYDFRSCTYHGAIVASMVIEIFLAAIATGIISPEDSRYYNRIYCGLEDLFYKLDHGYHCYDLFNERNFTYKVAQQQFPQIKIDRPLWEQFKQQHPYVAE